MEPVMTPREMRRNFVGGLFLGLRVISPIVWGLLGAIVLLAASWD